MNDQSPTERLSADGARQLLAALEGAIEELERRHPAGFGPGERVLSARVREAAQQLLAAARQMEREQLMVAGSTGQRRHNPLLKLQQELRREIQDGIDRLTFRVDQRAMYERLNDRHRARRARHQPEQPTEETP